MVFHRMERELWPALKTFLAFMSCLPEDVLPDVPGDMLIAKRLNEL